MKIIAIRLVLSFALSIQPPFLSEVEAGTKGSRNNQPAREVEVYWTDVKKVDLGQIGANKESFSFPLEELRKMNGEGAADILKNAISQQMRMVQKKKTADGAFEPLIQSWDDLSVLAAYMTLAPGSPLRDASFHSVDNTPYRVFITNDHTRADLFEKHTVQIFAEVHVSFLYDEDDE